MIRALLIFIFFLIIFTAAVFFAMQETGFVNFSYGDSEYTISLVNFVIGLFIVLPLVYIFFKTLGLIFNAPKMINNSMTNRRQNKALQNTQKGLSKYTQGDYSQSEKLLLSAADHSPSAEINYTWAARSAHMRGNYAERDTHLAAAKKSNPEHSSALDVLRAELLLDQHMPEQALASLSQQSDAVRSNPKIASLFAAAYEQLGDWTKLAELIPQLKGNKNIDAQTYNRIEKQTLKGLLGNNQIDSNLDEIGTKFRDAIAADNELTLDYVSALRQQGRHDIAESTAVSALDKKWCTKLVREYGLIDLKDPSQALNKAKQWVDQHTSDENLYLTLGRICNKAQLWGKAKTYFESSLSRKPLAETYAELTTLHEQLNEMGDAHKCAKKGLKLATRAK
jgi:HemY protein